jgi:type IV pilus assembly protein PilP
MHMTETNRQVTYFTAMAKRLLLGALFIFVAGCSSQQYGDLDKYIEDVKQKTKGRIEPLPEVKTYESQPYSATDLRDPFTPYAEEPSEELAQPGIQPNMQRKRESLEAFPLDSLAFVGHLEKDGTLWGLISAPDKSIYRVSVGNHLGKNYGEIMSISETSIMLKEIISNGSGGWVEREASLALTE